MQPDPILEYRYPPDENDDLSAINELTDEEILDLQKRTDVDEDLYKLLITEFGNKTFCIQTDSDWMFGNETWSEMFLFHKEAEERIQADWKGRQNVPKIDPSFIKIYKFADLQYFEDEHIKEYILDELELLFLIT